MNNNENRYFQFLAGERKGEVLLFDKIEFDDGDNFICFKDGSRCNEEFILPLNEPISEGILMAEVSDHKNVWKFKESWVGRQEEKWAKNKAGEKVCVQPFVEGRKKIEAIPPRKTKSKFSNFVPQQTAIQEPPKTEKEKIIKKYKDDPVWIMAEKSRKYDTQIPMILTVSLPTKRLFSVIEESFDNGAEKFVEYIISNLDDKALKTALKKALVEAYTTSEYKNENKYVNNDLTSVNTMSYEPEVIEEPKIGEPIMQINSKDENKK